MVCVLNIHQIGIQIRKDRLYGLPGCAGHTLNCCSDSPFLCCTEQIPGKIRLAQALSSRKRHTAPRTIVIRPVPFHLFDHLSDCSVITNHLIFSQNLHILNSVFLGFRVTAPFASEHTALQKNNSSYSRSAGHQTPCPLYPNSPCFPLSVKIPALYGG